MKRNLSLLLIFFLLVLSLIGCKENDEGSNEKIRIGIIRVPNDTSVAIQEKYFEEIFESKGIKPEFIFFDSGVSANQAFLSGSIDFAEMGFTNAVVALSNELPVKLIWIHEILGTNEALVVKDPTIETIRDLKGKKVATIFNSTSHFSLLKSLELAGLTDQDISLLNMDTAEIVAAWERGDLDAAYTWEPTLSQIQASGKTLITSEDLADHGIITANVRLVHSDFAEKHPDLVVNLIDALSKAGQLYKNDPSRAIGAAADYIGIDFEEAKKQIEGTSWLSREQQISSDYMGPDGGFINTFKETSDYWYKQGFIIREIKMEEILEFIDTNYIEQSMKESI